jgi:hypothetical protein
MFDRTIVLKRRGNREGYAPLVDTVVVVVTVAAAVR